MLYRVLPLSLAFLVAAAVTVAVAADKTSAPDKSNSTVTGTVSATGDNSITVTDNNGKDQKLNVSKDVVVTCDGKDCKIADLKKGATVTATVKKDGDNTVVTKIEAKSAAAKDKEPSKDK